MALLKGKLFAGALFAGTLLGGVQEATAIQQASFGGLRHQLAAEKKAWQDMRKRQIAEDEEVISVIFQAIIDGRLH